MSYEQFRQYMDQYRQELQDNDKGDWSEEAREWAIKVGLEKGVPQVVTEVPLDDEALGQVFADHGFKAAAELQVMSGPAC